MALQQRNTVRHNRGTEIIEAGNIRFGLEMRTVGPDGGMAIHVLGDIAGQEVELLAFDCFRTYPHYHYGPMSKNERIFWDTTLVPNALQWTLEQFKAGKSRPCCGHRLPATPGPRCASVRTRRSLQ
jgi:hypothetical protein